MTPEEISRRINELYQKYGDDWYRTPEGYEFAQANGIASAAPQPGLTYGNEYLKERRQTEPGSGGGFGLPADFVRRLAQLQEQAAIPDAPATPSPRAPEGYAEPVYQTGGPSPKEPYVPPGRGGFGIPGDTRRRIAEFYNEKPQPDPNLYPGGKRGAEATGSRDEGKGEGTGAGGNAITEPADQAIGAIGGFSGLIPESQLSNAWNSPEALIKLWADEQKWDPAGGGEASLQNTMGGSLGILWMLANDMDGIGVGSEQTPSTRQYLNWMDPFLSSITTPGQTNALMSNPGAVMDTILNPQTPDLQTYLGARGGPGSANLTRSDQIDNVVNALRYALQPSMPTPIMNAILNIASVKGRELLANELTGQTSGNYLDLLSESLGRG